jgi:2'-5' RNA ligase
VNARRSIITDPAHLAEAAGTAYVCLRPGGEAEETFNRIQRDLREAGGDDRSSWPAVHMTLEGFGTPARPVDHDLEGQLGPLVEGWARETEPLELQIEGLDVFADDRIPIVLIRRTSPLTAAHHDLQTRVEPTGLPSKDEISLQDWIFHLSLVYYDGDRWPDLEAAVRAITVPAASCVVREAELVGFEGGPERLLGRFPFIGSA